MTLELPRTVEFLGADLKVSPVKNFPMFNVGFEGGKYDFELINVVGAEAGFYHINGGETTRVLKIVQEVLCVEKLVQGQGWFLKMDKDGYISSREFDVAKEDNNLISYGRGDTIVWGGKTEMRAVTFSDRPFLDSMEEAFEIDSQELPLEFWKEYHRLVESSKL